MNRIYILMAFLSTFYSLVAQESFNISKPEVSFINKILTIKYDVIGCGTNEIIEIKLIVLNSKGDTIKPLYVTGDLGKNVRCGFGKSITWNIERDRISIVDDISILIKGVKSVPDIPGFSLLSKNEISRKKVILNSVLVPGLGQSKASGKKCYLVFSALTYGTLGMAVYYSTQTTKYGDYYQAATGTDRDIFYSKWENSYNMSKYFTIGSVGIWITNMIWSGIIPINKNYGKKMSINLNTSGMNEFCLNAKWNF